MLSRLRQILILCAALAGLTLASCGTKQITAEPQLPEPVTVMDWQDLYLPATFNLNSPKSFSLSGRITFVRDKHIQLSLRFLGMEVAVIDITPEQIIAVDKYHKMALSEPITPLLNSAGITFSDLQDAFLGSASDAVLSKLDSTPVSLTYGPMVTSPEGSIPRFIAISASVGGTPLEFELYYKPEKADWNSGRTAGVNIPSNYKIIDARSLLENIHIDL